MAAAFTGGDGGGHCQLCGQVARERWHVVVDCAVVKGVWARLEGTLVQLVAGPVSKGEMAFGCLGGGDADELRRRLGFVLRAAVHSLRGVEMGGARRAEEAVWAFFLGRLKKELVEAWYVAKVGGKEGEFERRVLFGGVLGHLGPGGSVVWGGLLDGVGYRGWDLFG